MAAPAADKIRFMREVLGVNMPDPPPPDGPSMAGSAGPALGLPQLDPNSPVIRSMVGTDTAMATADAKRWITDYLRAKDLRPDIVDDPSGRMVMFDNKSTPVADVIKLVVAAGQAAPLPGGDAAHAAINRKSVGRAVTKMLLAAIPKPPSASPEKKASEAYDGPNVSMQLSYTFTPETDHTTASGAQSKDQPAHQIAGTLNVAFHADNEDGFEIGATAAITIFADDKDKPDIPQSAFAGLQLAWVKSFLEGALTAGPMLTAVAGASRAQQTASGKLEWVPTGQVGVGGQVQYAIPGFKGHVMIGAQVGISATIAKGAESTIDQAAALTFTYKF